MLATAKQDLTFLAMGYPGAFIKKGTTYQCIEAHNQPDKSYFVCCEPRGDWCKVQLDEVDILIPPSFSLRCEQCDMSYTEFYPQMFEPDRATADTLMNKVQRFINQHHKCGSKDDPKLKVFNPLKYDGSMAHAEE